MREDVIFVLFQWLEKMLRSIFLLQLLKLRFTEEAH